MSSVLVDILIVLVAAKLSAEAAERVRLPAVVGEIVAGVLIGPSVLGLVEGGEVLHTLAEVGVILLLLQVGMEMDLADLGAVGRPALVVAVVGVAVPMFLGAVVMGAFGENGDIALFLGAALTATSVGITARVLGDMRALATTEARTVLGAAVVDDVMGLVILTVVVRVVTGGGVSAASVAGIAAAALGFLVVAVAVGTRLAPSLFGAVHRVARSPGTLVALAFAFALSVSELATVAKLAPIVGAFVAGLALARSDQAERIRLELTPVGHLFVPVFFLQIGIDADLGAMLHPRVLVVAAALFAVGSIGKLVSAVGARGDKLTVGIGMLPRGEVGLIFAGIGLREGVLNKDLYGALLLVVLATTLVTPPLLGWRIRTVNRRRRLEPAAARPTGGWLSVDTNGIVDLAAEPPAGEASRMALEAAVLLARGRPGPRLLGWFGSLAGEEATPWDRRDTVLLLRLLADGNARSWRFLELTGMLDRTLPELGRALRRRRGDWAELDPMHALQWALVDRVQALGDVLDDLEHPERLQLVAVALEVGTDESRGLVQRLELGAEAEQEIVFLVEQSNLLRAAARRLDGLDEERVLALAAHLGTPERARSLYLLTIAVNELGPVDRARVDELHAQLQIALKDPAIGSRADRLQRAAALAPSHLVADRVLHTPTAYALRQAPEVLARQAELLEPIPPRGRVRVAVAGDRIEVGARDEVGLLASVSTALTGIGLDLVEADAVTWPDGGAVEAFRVRGAEVPSAEEVQARIEQCMASDLTTAPVVDAAIVFDDHASPWHTLCQVGAGDAPGLLSALAAAFAAGGATVHAASVTTSGGRVCDRFEVTTADGNKLGEAEKAAVARALAHGARLTTGRFGRTRKAMTVP